MFASFRAERMNVWRAGEAGEFGSEGWGGREGKGLGCKWKREGLDWLDILRVKCQRGKGDIV